MLSKVITISKYVAIVAVVVGIGAIKLMSDYETDSYYELKGYVGFETSNIGSFSSGTVIDINVVEGDFVEEGEVIMELENNLLTERLEGIDINSPNFDEAEYRVLQERINRLVITSPITGYVKDINYQKGGFVKESEIVAEIIPQDTLSYRALISDFEKNVQPIEFQTQLKEEHPVKVEIVETGKTYDGKIAFIERNDDFGLPNDTSIIKIELTEDKTIAFDEELNILFEKESFLKRNLELINKIASKL